MKDIKSQILTAFALTSTSVTAGGGGDNAAINGATITIANLARRPQSVSFEIPCRAVLAAGKKLTVTGKVQESVDGSTWTDVADAATLLTLLDSGSGSTLTGVARVGANVIRKNSAYVRCVITPDLDASGTDTAVVGAGVAVFGGLSVEP